MLIGVPEIGRRFQALVERGDQALLRIVEISIRGATGQRDDEVRSLSLSSEVKLFGFDSHDPIERGFSDR